MPCVAHRDNQHKCEGTAGTGFSKTASLTRTRRSSQSQVFEAMPAVLTRGTRLAPQRFGAVSAAATTPADTASAS